MSKQFAFNSLPLVKKRRSAFDLSHSVKTTMNAGTLYPIYLQEVYPGDTFKDKTNIVARVSSAFLRPVVDNAFMDVYFFFVPNRLVYDKWSQVMGENVSGAWAQQTPVPAPFYSPDNTDADNNGVVFPGSVGDYLGLPLTSVISSGGVTINNKVKFDFNLLPFRAFALIWDEWFRDQNNIQPMNIIKGDYNATFEKPNNNAWSPNNYMGKLPKVGKVHDYFTSCLPAPQKGGAVELGGGSSSERVLPVTPILLQNESDVANTPLAKLSASRAQVLVSEAGYTPKTDLPTLYNAPQYFVAAGGPGVTGPYNPQVDFKVGMGVMKSSTLFGIGGPIEGSNVDDGGVVYPSNLFAYDEGSTVNPLSINDLRYAIALQRMLEKDALGGNRYTEYLLSHFGVLSPDARLQRSELLGGHRFPLSVQQVAQTSEPTQGNPLGSLGAYSLSNGGARFTKGFVEHGFVIGVACIRQYHTYQQGLERFWSRKNRIDYYDPVFAHIGEQPVYKRELFTTGNDQADVFGYNEAWADLRYRPNRLTGQMRSDIGNSLDIWHFADDYANAPTLNQDFIQETPAYIDRTLAVSSESQDQFLVDIYHQVRAYRCLPVYSTPSTLGA